MGYAWPFGADNRNIVDFQVGARRRATQDDGKLLGLELLRFASALAVLLCHYKLFAQMMGMPAVARSAQPFYALLWPFYDHGYYGVQVFWGISGFIFFRKYGAAIHSRLVTAGEFFWLRFSRLYPLHIATLAAVVALQAVHRDLAGRDFAYPATDGAMLVRQLFLATDWTTRARLSFNGPIWSISAEIAVYVCFFLLARRFAPSWRLCLGVVVAGLALELAGLRWASIGCATYFFAGGLAAIMSANRRAAAAGALGAIIIVGWFSGALGDRGKLPTILLLAVPCLLILMSQPMVFADRWQRAIQFAGNLTYSSYLLHFPLQILLAILVAASGATPPLASPLFLLAYLGVTLSLAALSYRLFELPAQKWLRGLSLQRPTPA